MRAVGKRALCDSIVFLPVRTAHIPVGEPFLFGLEVLHLEVEDAVVRDEGFEPFVVVPRQPIYAETAERGTDAPEVVFVHVRLGAELIDRRQVVQHTLSSVVSADLFVPLLSEARQTATVRGYDDIIAGRHHHEVPPERPELAYRTLRTAFTIEDGRIFLVRVEMRRVDDPRQHHFAVRCLLPARLNRRALYLLVYIVVLVRQLWYFFLQCRVRLLPIDAARTEFAGRVVEVLLHVHAVDLIRLTHRVTEQIRILVAYIA